MNVEKSVTKFGVEQPVEQFSVHVKPSSEHWKGVNRGHTIFCTFKRTIERPATDETQKLSMDIL